MREILAVTSWFALTVTLWITAYVWPLFGHVLVPLGAIGMAFVVLLLGEVVVHEVRGVVRARRYERQQAEWLARRKRREGSGE
ncbi:MULTISPECIES: hypothetical protein [unclassified Nonomuraea]|uniref:hypothetical protein n=1 Tax=unclassified Nonomuraea TaxID=2593643 RepID=UPI0033C7B3A5